MSTEIKIRDLRVCMPPAKLNTTTHLLATFTLIAFPVVVTDVRLVRIDGKIETRAPATEIRFIAAGRDEITAAAKETMREALAEMQALD